MHYTAKQGKSPSNDISSDCLIYARALGAWANSVGMTQVQRDLYVYVASMLATNDKCWISVHHIAKEVGYSRRHCRRAIASGGAFFEHDSYEDEHRHSPKTKRFWKLVMPVPTKKDLEPFLPRTKCPSQVGQNVRGGELGQNVHRVEIENTTSNAIGVERSMSERVHPTLGENSGERKRVDEAVKELSQLATLTARPSTQQLAELLIGYGRQLVLAAIPDKSWVTPKVEAHVKDLVAYGRPKPDVADKKFAKHFVAISQMIQKQQEDTCKHIQ